MNVEFSLSVSFFLYIHPLVKPNFNQADQFATRCLFAFTLSKDGMVPKEMLHVILIFCPLLLRVKVLTKAGLLIEGKWLDFAVHAVFLEPCPSVLILYYQAFLIFNVVKKKNKSLWIFTRFSSFKMCDDSLTPNHNVAQ